MIFGNKKHAYVTVEMPYIIDESKYLTNLPFKGKEILLITKTDFVMCMAKFFCGIFFYLSDLKTSNSVPAKAE